MFSWFYVFKFLYCFLVIRRGEAQNVASKIAVLYQKDNLLDQRPYFLDQKLLIERIMKPSSPNFIGNKAFALNVW
ncbi:hypothetical protein DHW03_10545 [Pedobacter yonginense]|uniref:Uncharacterized protein n=1 Tax=Pedobacter yonginense TaxID=651869 RepID=A0A317EN53_9SPHI|nr:hypothetical protein DHW03_10545 [Pedobacter yonginense]